MAKGRVCWFIFIGSFRADKKASKIRNFLSGISISRTLYFQNTPRIFAEVLIPLWKGLNKEEIN
jgi:hypothetical protein